MKNIIQTSILIISLLLFNGCHKKECLSKDAYNGLYNALTCDYESRIASLTTNISQEKLQDAELFTAYQELIAKVTNKELELKQYKQSIQKTDSLLNEIEVDLNSIDTKQDTKEILTKIRYQVISMHDNINIQQPKFSTDDIHYAKKQIKLNKMKKAKKIDLAKKFLEKNDTKKVKLTKAYNKNYQENREIQEKLQKKLNESIRLILMGEKANHLDEKSKEKIMTALKETRRYTNSVK